MAVAPRVRLRRCFQALLAWAILSSWGWRWLLGLSCIPLLGLLLLYPVLPESPYFLAAMGRTQEAQAVLTKLARINKRPLPPGILKQAAAPVKVRSIALLQAQRASVETCFSSCATCAVAHFLAVHVDTACACPRAHKPMWVAQQAILTVMKGAAGR